MALRETKTLTKKVEKHEQEEPGQDMFHQRKMPDNSQFRLQVDRQTKSSHTTCEAAQAAGLVIKTKFPILHVSVYDAVTGDNTVIELPAS